MNVHVVVTAFMLVVALWCAHLAGFSFALSREDKKYKRPAITRSILSIAAAAFVLFYS